MTITATYDALVRQASDTAAKYLWEAQEQIDKVFGKGYAAKNPELVSAFIKVAGQDFNTACLAVAVQEASGKIESALHAIADSNN
ncbi:hypothetical protein PS918_03085 [Pseudomonas fluorescens]|uniref:Uncharacterized protein n=1 Tax=Pseudomonas fluorescens TaxID=294 RepID=A0A5E7SRF6_PSEFL|nr:hypothetical protein [Pseudomonas fluorescens]VVP89422.1 hypothetical protein PS918_03085 [Pseudomonas fluorescens]